MPRYFFDFASRIDSPDDEGVECRDLKSAKVEAIRLMGDILREDAETIFFSEDCGVIVRDSQGRRLARVRTSIVSSPDAMPEPDERRFQPDLRLAG